MAKETTRRVLLLNDTHPTVPADDMADVTPLRANELDAFFKDLAKRSRTRDERGLIISHVWCMLQVEDEEEVVTICIEESGERSADPDHLVSVMGHHALASFLVSREAEESIAEGTE